MVLWFVLPKESWEPFRRQEPHVNLTKGLAVVGDGGLQEWVHRVSVQTGRDGFSLGW